MRIWWASFSTQVFTQKSKWRQGKSLSHFYRMTQVTLILLFSYSVVFDSLQPHGLQPTRLLCPWDFPGKSTGVGCHFLLQEVFPTQGWNLSLLQLLYWLVDFLLLSRQGRPQVTLRNPEAQQSGKDWRAGAELLCWSSDGVNSHEGHGQNSLLWI